MDKPIEHYWQLRLHSLQEQLVANNFAAHVVPDRVEAGKLILRRLIPEMKPVTISYGGSLSLRATGVLTELAEMGDYRLIRPDEPGISLDEKLERRRQGLLVDLYLSGTNALTDGGQLVNLDMIGNRVAALTFGPKRVIVVVGRNKLVADLEAAMNRIKEFAAPVNAMRLDMLTPCVQTAECADCRSSARICNSWTITEKSFPKERIVVVIVNEDLGF